MEEKIDYNTIIMQLQLENELLRSHMKTFTEVRQAVYRLPDLIQDLYQKAAANKYRLLVGLMIIYWAASIAFMVYDRLKG